MAEQISERYASALFEVALEDGLLEEIAPALAEVAKLFADEPQYVKLLCSPALTREKKEELITEAFENRIPDELLNFLLLLTDRGRIGSIAGIASAFAKQYNTHLGIREATAVTAIPLSDALLQKLKAKLEAITGDKVLLTNEVDPSILGGVILKGDFTEVDGSVKSRLAALKEQIASTIA